MGGEPVMEWKPQNAKKAESVAEAAAQCRIPVMEPKLDGWRMVAFITEDGPRVYSRTQKPYHGRYPEMEAELVKLPVGTILDGEIVDMVNQDSVAVTNVFGKSVGITTQEQRDALTYVVFDILHLGGIDLDVTGRPLEERRMLYLKLLERMELDPARVQPIAQLDEATDEDYDIYLSLGYEGVMVKDATKPYAKGKRGHGFFKVKAITEIDVIVTGMELNGKGQHTGKVGNFGVSQVKNGQVVQRAMVNPYDDAMRNAMTAAVKDAAANDLQSNSFFSRVCTIKHFGVLKDGLRHPVFVCWREDKLWNECEWDNGD